MIHKLKKVKELQVEKRMDINNFSKEKEIVRHNNNQKII